MVSKNKWFENKLVFGKKLKTTPKSLKKWVALALAQKRRGKKRTAYDTVDLTGGGSGSPEGPGDNGGPH